MFLMLKLEFGKLATNSDKFNNFSIKYPNISNGKNSRPTPIIKKEIKVRGKIIKLTKGIAIKLVKIP